MRSLRSLLIAALIFVLCAAPSYATTRTGSTTVTWNTSASALLVLNVNYASPGGAAGAAQPATIFGLVAPPAGSSCAPSAAAFSATTIDLGTITPPSTAAAFACLYSQAVNAQVTTSSTSWTLSEKLAVDPTNSFLVCALPNTGAAWPATPSTTAGAGRTNATGTSCPATTGLNATTAITMVNNSATAFTAASPANVGEDIQVLVPASPTNGAQTLTLNFTLVAN